MLEPCRNQARWKALLRTRSSLCDGRLGLAAPPMADAGATLGNLLHCNVLGFKAESEF
jgi:hypothetical protein